MRELTHVVLHLLQMLNCCIERRKARESATYRDISVTDGGTLIDKEIENYNEDDDDDEFYECETDSAAAAANTSQSATSPMQCDDNDACDTSTEFADSLVYQPDGRLKPCGDLQLLSVNERLYVPVTQEPAPMTEDMLEEHAEVLARYGYCRHACWYSLSK